jgi:hypothetical protein
MLEYGSRKPQNMLGCLQLNLCLLCSVEQKTFFAPLALHLSNLLTSNSTGKPREQSTYRLYDTHTHTHTEKTDKKIEKKRGHLLHHGHLQSNLLTLVQKHMHI